MAVFLVREGEHAAAEPLYREGLELRLEKLGAMHVDTAASQQNLGLLLMDLGRFDEAEECMQESLRVTMSLFGSGHVDTAGCYRSLAGLSQCRGDEANFKRAIDYYSRALPIYEQNLGVLHVDYALTCKRYGR